MWTFLGTIKLLLLILRNRLVRLGKWFLRKVTRLCELQRIIYGELRGSRRTRLVEESLNGSRCVEIRRVLKELEAGVDDGRFDLRGTRKALTSRCAFNISAAKAISIKSHAKFLSGLGECLEFIYALKCLNVRLEMQRRTSYSIENDQHEQKLLELWENLMSPKKLSGRKSREWQYLGFQGNDPATDFRGAGILALEVLLYLSRVYPEMGRTLLTNSHHPLYSYPFALLSIQITFMAYELCVQGLARPHFYNRSGLLLSLDDRAGPRDTHLWGRELVNLFYEFCCSLMVEFDTFWFASKPKDIMEFGRIKAEYDQLIKRKLADDNVCFLMEVRTI